PVGTPGTNLSGRRADPSAGVIQKYDDNQDLCDPWRMDQRQADGCRATLSSREREPLLLQTALIRIAQLNVHLARRRVDDFRWKRQFQRRFSGGCVGCLATVAQP